jgi:hypothetical protein
VHEQERRAASAASNSPRTNRGKQHITIFVRDLLKDRHTLWDSPGADDQSHSRRVYDDLKEAEIDFGCTDLGVYLCSCKLSDER